MYVKNNVFKVSFLILEVVVRIECIYRFICYFDLVSKFNIIFFLILFKVLIGFFFEIKLVKVDLKGLYIVVFYKGNWL